MSPSSTTLMVLLPRCLPPVSSWATCMPVIVDRAYPLAHGVHEDARADRG